MSRANPTTGVIKAIAEEAAIAPLNAGVELDTDNVFLLFASFCGDIEQTAYASSLSIESVQALAAEGKWSDRLRGIIELKKSQKPGAVEKAINRALCFTQATHFGEYDKAHHSNEPRRVA